MLPATTNFINWLNSYTGGKIVYTVEIAGYSRVYSNAIGTGATGEFPYLGDIDDLSMSLKDLEGGADQTSFGFNVQDFAGQITGDFPGFVFEGKAVTIKMGSLSLAYADYCPIFKGFVDSVASVNSNNDYYFNLVDLTQLLQRPIYLTGDNGLPTSSSNIRTVQGNPLDLLLNILEVQLGISPSLIDVATITAYRDGPFNGMSELFYLDTAPTALDFIQKQIMKPLGGYLWSGGSGYIGVKFFYPLVAPTTVMTIDESVFMGVPEADETAMVNTVQFQFDKPSSGGTGTYNSEDTETYAPSVALYGQYGEQVIQADGLRSGFQGFFNAKFIARIIFLRYGFKNLSLGGNGGQSASVDSLIKTVLLEFGDITGVTHRLVPDRKLGVIGISNKLFEVVGKTYHFQDGTTTLALIDASYLTSFGAFKIAPAGHVNYVASSTADKAKYMFLTNDAGKYSTGADGNVLG